MFAPNSQMWVDPSGLFRRKIIELIINGLKTIGGKIRDAWRRWRCGKCHLQQRQGNAKGKIVGGVPNSVYTQTATRGNQKIAIQNVIYDDKGRAIAHVDFKPHHGQVAGHAHVFKQPGKPGSGHGANNSDSVLHPNNVPTEWKKLPSDVIPHTPIGHR